MATKKLSVGEEMMQWAEKYWHIDKVCKGEAPTGGEAFNYDYFRNVFVKGIDDNIARRLNQPIEPENVGEI